MDIEGFPYSTSVTPATAEVFFLKVGDKMSSDPVKREVDFLSCSFPFPRLREKSCTMCASNLEDKYEFSAGRSNMGGV